MKLIVAVLVLLACSLVQASDGAGYVPAHRTKDGHYVPPNEWLVPVLKLVNDIW